MVAPNIDIMLKIVPFILPRKVSHIVRNPQLYIILRVYKQPKNEKMTLNKHFF